MIERVIENWLTNTNERNYQIAFCHMLMQKGYKVIYVSTHRPMEQGKDIIAIDLSGECVAYQLKTGDIKLPTWRAIKGEVMELIELPIVHPSCNKMKTHKSYLVFNGQMTDEVRHQIDQINEHNSRLGKDYSYLDIIDKNVLIVEFIEAQGKFMPKELEDFNLFLELFLANGTDFLDKKKLFHFLNSTFFSNSSNLSEAKNNIYCSVIFTSYMLNAFQIQNNYYALFEGWSVLVACIIRFSSKQGLKHKDIKNNIELIYDEIGKNMDLLKNETLDKKTFLEGDLMGDGGDIYKARATIVLGTLASYEIFSSLRNHEHKFNDELLNLLIENFKNLKLWGESAFPFFFFIIKYLELNNESEIAKSLLRSVTETVITMNSFESKVGLASPYYSVNELFEAVFFDIEKVNFNEFTGSSYTLECLIHMLARRNDRVILESYWRIISNIQFKETRLDNVEDIFTWRVENGLNYAQFPKATQSWKELVNDSNDTEDTPSLFHEQLPFLCIFIIVCPHRISSKIIKLIDYPK